MGRFYHEESGMAHPKSLVTTIIIKVKSNFLGMRKRMINKKRVGGLPHYCPMT